MVIAIPKRTLRKTHSFIISHIYVENVTNIFIVDVESVNFCKKKKESVMKNEEGKDI